MAEKDRGNTLQADEIPSYLNADINPDGTTNEITQHLDVASTQPDTTVTSQGTNVRDPITTLPGVEGETEGKRDTQSAWPSGGCSHVRPTDDAC